MVLMGALKRNTSNELSLVNFELLLFYLIMKFYLKINVDNGTMMGLLFFFVVPVHFLTAIAFLHIFVLGK